MGKTNDLGRFLAEDSPVSSTLGRPAINPIRSPYICLLFILSESKICSAKSKLCVLVEFIQSLSTWQTEMTLSDRIGRHTVILFLDGHLLPPWLDMCREIHSAGA